ncbi:MBL fold metallo-hydrolase [Janthinobacterium sp. Mn2066]|uniref:MBL fold metallo-hydrolase n=1 Tax=Janthinobacterium sp. Mn2066 TaxID=3395264 RepID=UPI003BC209B9
MKKALAFAVWLAVSTAAIAASTTPAAVPDGPVARTFHVGALEVIALRDKVRTIPNDAKVFGAETGTAAVAAVLAEAGAPTDHIGLSVDALLVKDGAQTILLDTGLGPAAQGLLLASLKQTSYTPEQITDVLITHVHGDHVGGLVTSGGTQAFAKAIVHISAPDWAWLQGQANMAALVKIISPQVVTFAPGDQLTPSIRSLPLKGHTPGHVGYQIVSGKARLLDVGDLVHNPILSLAKPDWAIAFDKDRTEGATTRRAELAKLAADHETIFAPHFPFPGIGTIKAVGDHFVWQPAN